MKRKFLLAASVTALAVFAGRKPLGKRLQTVKAHVDDCKRLCCASAA